jgi:CheY-like chemotaxis protein
MNSVEPRVLVVDDDAVIIAIVRATLESYGYAVATATGDAAVSLAADTQPAMVLLDLVMPGLDGYAVARRLHADPRTADVPIILMSASSDLRQAAAQIGARGFLEKPLDPEVLHRTVAALASRAGVCADNACADGAWPSINHRRRPSSQPRLSRSQRSE